MNTTTEKKPEVFKIKEWIKNHPHNQDIVDNLILELEQYIKTYYPKRKNIPYAEWYCGISKDPLNDRTKGHKSRKKLTELKHFKHFQALSVSNARKIEETLCVSWGLNNCKVYGGIKQTSKFVYVYNHKKSPTQYVEVVEL